MPSSPVAKSVNCRMSVPATNASPAPRRTKTRMCSVASTSSHARASASYTAHVMALRASGRLNVKYATGPSDVNNTSEVVTMGSLSKGQSPFSKKGECPLIRGDKAMSTGRGALAGIRVLDVTQVMAGPFCAMQLCDMGADVIKVEPPEGDSTRHMAGALGTDSPGFNAVNRGKRGIVLDLKTVPAQEAFRRLAQRADILIENYRPGVMRSFGLDYPSLAPAHPGLIYASISGYGQTGPDASRGGFDLIAQGASGLMSVTGEPGRPPVKVGGPLTDLGAGLFALSAVLAALHYRHRTGHGQYIDTSLIEAGIALSVWESAQYFS